MGGVISQKFLQTAIVICFTIAMRFNINLFLYFWKIHLTVKGIIVRSYLSTIFHNQFRFGTIDAP